MYMHSSKQIHSPWEGILSCTATRTGLACNSMNENPSLCSRSYKLSAWDYMHSQANSVSNFTKRDMKRESFDNS